jgi:hypothetical protein
VAFGSLPTTVLPQANSAYFSGNVGIGTTDPKAQLDINGALKATTFNGNTITTGNGILTLGAGKTLTSNVSITLAGTDGSQLSLAGNMTTSGAYATTLTTTNTTNVTLPTTGTLATLAGAETFTNKISYNGLVITANTGTITTGV